MRYISLSVVVFILPTMMTAKPSNPCEPYSKILQKNIKRIGIPAVSFSTILPSGIQVSCAEGISNIDKKTLANTEDLYEIASVTKTFVAALTLLMIGQHKLKLDETIAQTVEKYGQWLPKKAAKAWGNVTLRQLMNMTSGIYNYTDNANFNKQWRSQSTKAWKAKQIIDIALSQPSYFKPGKGWHYSDTNYYLLGMLLERVNKRPLGRQINWWLLRPLGIEDIAYVPHQYSKNLSQRMAKGYGKNLINRTNVNMSQAGAAGAMIAQPSRLVEWLHALFNGKILSKESLQQMLTPYSKTTGQITDNPKQDAYGLGVFRSYYPARDGANWGYLGGAWGYSTWYQWNPKTNIIFVASVNVGMKYHGKQKKSAEYEVVHELAPALYNQIRILSTIH
ncbi:MAG: serine hydrolase [Coxiellaceae bacterium]|nr:serine hydrolase [Coxiellaceae bacterium]